MSKTINWNPPEISWNIWQGDAEQYGKSMARAAVNELGTDTGEDENGVWFSIDGTTYRTAEILSASVDNIKIRLKNPEDSFKVNQETLERMADETNVEYGVETIVPSSASGTDGWKLANISNGVGASGTVVYREKGDNYTVLKPNAVNKVTGGTGATMITVSSLENLSVGDYTMTAQDSKNMLSKWFSDNGKRDLMSYVDAESTDVVPISEPDTEDDSSSSGGGSSQDSGGLDYSGDSGDTSGNTNEESDSISPQESQSSTSGPSYEDTETEDVVKTATTGRFVSAMDAEPVESILDSADEGDSNPRGTGQDSRPTGPESEIGTTSIDTTNPDDAQVVDAGLGRNQGLGSDSGIVTPGRLLAGGAALGATYFIAKKLGGDNNDGLPRTYRQRQ